MLLVVETVLVTRNGLEGLALLIGYIVIAGGALWAVCGVAAWILWHLSGIFGGPGTRALICGAVVSVTVWGWVSDYRQAKKKRLPARADLTECPFVGGWLTAERYRKRQSVIGG